MQALRSLEPHQARQRPPTLFEDLLGDAIERAFAAGAHTLPELVAQLNDGGSSSANGEAWTEHNFQALMSRLGS